MGLRPFSFHQHPSRRFGQWTIRASVLDANKCQGTSDGDVLTGTSANDSIAGLAGRAGSTTPPSKIIDTISGGPDNDTIDVREGNVGLNNGDLVDCGMGDRDRVFFDAGEVGDKIVKCEIKNPN